MEKENNQRLKLGMTLFEMLYAMSGGNPGSLRVLNDMLKKNEMNFFKIASLDTVGIYDNSIWDLYKYVCDEDLEKFTALISEMNGNAVKRKEVMDKLKILQSK